MWSNLIVVSLPVIDFGLGVLQTFKPKLIQAIVPELTVEAFHKRILGGLPRLNKLQLDISTLRPEEHCFTRELRAVVANNNGGLASLVADALQIPGHPCARNRYIY